MKDALKTLREVAAVTAPGGPMRAAATAGAEEIARLRAEVAGLRETLDRVKAAIGDRLLAKGPLSLPYAHGVMRDIDAALAGREGGGDEASQV